ncbi:mitochondrial import inner membrane translocase subunit Tim23 isoform X2 [Tamandua tetradactyla]|uniref:mitochondrial import inner membrane translocase subunit Tim23 isoform X2 n=1 Tax=Tamandua tetradactyla TaxID=48850 RepID=UPI00405417E8
MIKPILWPIFSWCENLHHQCKTKLGLRAPGGDTPPACQIGRDTDEFILPTGANKTRGRFELAFFTIGGCCMTGAAFGAMNGLRLGLKETQTMAWSKPRNVQILNMVTRQGALWANTLGSLALLYSAFGVIIEKTRGAEDDLNTVAAGTMTGMLYKCTGGLRGIARGGLAGLTLTSLYALYNNWEHMKGSLLQQSL